MTRKLIVVIGAAMILLALNALFLVALVTSWLLKLSITGKKRGGSGSKCQVTSLLLRSARVSTAWYSTLKRESLPAPRCCKKEVTATNKELLTMTMPLWVFVLAGILGGLGLDWWQSRRIKK
jgi:hypothetical protein